LEGLVKKHVEEGRLYAAVCAAPAVVLGPWGLVNGLKVKFAMQSTLLCCVAAGDGFGDSVCVWLLDRRLVFLH